MPKTEKAPVKRVITEADFSRLLLATWPEMAIKPGFQELENPESELSLYRKSCILKGSEAAFLWNCKRGKSYSRFLKELTGKRERDPPNEWTLSLMKMGREYEPIINERFCAAMQHEYLHVYKEFDDLSFRLPGPFGCLQDNTCATPDGLICFKVPGKKNISSDGKSAYKENDWWHMMPYEIKFFASYSEFPTEPPTDYLAQLLMQMVHAGGARISLLVCGLLQDGKLHLRIWKIKASTDHIMDYHTRFFHFKQDLAADVFPKRSPNLGATLKDMVVGEADSAEEAWEFILDNLHSLPRSGPRFKLILPLSLRL